MTDSYAEDATALAVRGPAFADLAITVPTERRSARTALWREGLRRRLLALFDALAIGMALALAIESPFSLDEAVTLVIAMPLAILLFKVAGLYDRDELVLRRSTLDEAPALLQLTGFIALLALLVDPIVRNGDLATGDVLVIWLAGFAFVCLARRVARSLAGRLTPVERCLVVGDIAHADRIGSKLESAGARACVAAMLPVESDELDGARGPENLRQVVSQLDIHRVIIAPVSADYASVADLIRAARGAGVPVSVVPRILEAVGSSVEFDELHGMTMLGVRRFGLSRSSRTLKRTFDVLGSSIALLAVAPVMLAIAIAIRLDSRGSIFFSQTRVGRDGRHFQMVKFRSMVSDAEQLKDDLRDLNEAGDGLFKVREDPRVTRVGRFLRSASLDELPQLFNVLRGDMSLVGPRPLVVDEDAQVLGLYRSRLHLTPGITGPWQVLGSTRVPMDEMVGMDYLYVANWSLWGDVKVLVRTGLQVLTRSNV